MNAPKPNAELAYRVLDHIDAHPEQWQQLHWWTYRDPECGTAGCFAGWAVHLSGEQMGPGNEVGGVHVSERAAQLLGFAQERELNAVGLAATFPDGLPEDERDWIEYELFSAVNTRADLGRLIEAIFGPRPGGAS